MDIGCAKTFPIETAAIKNNCDETALFLYADDTSEEFVRVARHLGADRMIDSTRIREEVEDFLEEQNARNEKVAGA